MIRNWIRKRTNKIAVIDGEKSILHADLCKMIDAVANAVSARAADRIALYLPDDSAFIAAFFGVLAAGKIVFPIHIQMTEYEVLSLLECADADAVITARRYGRLFERPEGAAESSLSVLYAEDVCRPVHSEPLDPVPIDPDAPLVLLNTSGTTGNAKLVQLSQRNIEASTLGYLERLNADAHPEEFRIVLATPLATSYGMMILTASVLRGFTLVLLPPDFTLSTLFRIVERHRVTHYEGGALTLQLMNRMAERANPYNIRSLHYVGFGGSKLSGDEIERLEKAYPQVKFCQGYGMSEASPLIAKHPTASLKKTQSCGTAIRGVSIAVEADGGITTEPYVKGELVIRGANVMLGYYNNKKETDKSIRGGYLYSGDIGYLDDEGYVYLCGRKKNIIIVRGFNVHPEEVEGCLLSGGLVLDCMVYGQRSALGDEIVCADVVPSHSRVTAELLGTYCAARLAKYKRPEKIRICGAVKKNAAGKTKRIR